jgi:hypothetical protein
MYNRKLIWGRIIKQIGYCFSKMAGLNIVIGLCIVLSSCGGNSETIWSAEAKSPNGKWLAQASTLQSSGFGTADVETGVYLKWVAGAHPPTMILGFSDNSAYPSGATNVKMRWITNSHLDVMYGAGATLNFQAIKAGGIEITAGESTCEMRHQCSSDQSHVP